MTHVVVITTTATADAAADLGRAAVTRGLAACAQLVGPIRSIYRWEGAVQDDTEHQCWLKTTLEQVEPLTAFITEHHDYDVPEVIALPVVGGSPAYLDWVSAAVR
ncbi:divalent-cation tolerance protein CutA [Actinokineospora fastidiosa]|uniref:Divalent cation tolerance protein n=1 Tax=Actinokineospora fastidiosa TaxID=1816 RepID=A0A918GD12_9PSEU|nr:divalent-cation tolerance protein CutA [Actinokineospora fastidiosa]GGS26478.1 divalent cation tolerance protein [Actinokineospora fastidiosa]